MSEGPRLRFRTCVEDMVAHSLVFMERSPATRRSQLKGIVASIGIITIAILLGAIALRDYRFLWAALPVAALMAWLLPRRFRSANRDLLEKIHGEQMSGLTDEELESTMTLEEDGVRFESMHGRGLLFWKSIESLDELPDHVHLKFRSTLTVIVPRHRVLEGDLPAFLTELRRRVEEATGSPPPESPRT